MQNVQLLGSQLLGFGDTNTYCTQAANPGVTCVAPSASAPCANILAGDPYRTGAGNECTGSDGGIYVFDASGTLSPQPWYRSTWGMLGIGAVALVGGFFLFGTGGTGSGDVMRGLFGKRRRRRR